LGDALFDTLVGARGGAAFTRHDYADIWSLIDYPDGKIRLVVPGMLEWLGHLDPALTNAPHDFPFILAAGQRRMFNANQIFRDPAWRREDPDGALLINPLDLADLGVSSGTWIAIQSATGRLIVRCKADATMRRGQLALPHGYGQAFPAADGEGLFTGPRINWLTQAVYGDPIAGTPHH
jgi:anaerobic selenocysteine-containing dehydrogenase